MRALPFGETVTLVRRELAVGGDGKTLRNAYGEAQYVDVSYPVEGCAVAPAGSAGQAFSFEGVGQRFSQVSTRFVVQFPPGTAADLADSDDRVFWRGRAFEIEGEPGPSFSPFSGMAGPVEAYIRRVAG